MAYLPTFMITRSYDASSQEFKKEIKAKYCWMEKFLAEIYTFFFTLVSSKNREKVKKLFLEPMIMN